MVFEVILWVLLSFAVLSALIYGLYLLAVRGRNGYADWSALGAKPFAHRGLHDAQKPENSLAAFKAAKLNGYGAEFDVHLLKDGTLAVFHDSTLIRMTGKEGVVEDLTAKNLQEYYLNGTKETIPTFDEVLQVFDGNEPLVIELKHHGRNAAALCKALCDRLDSYNGTYCIESFDPRCVLWLKKNRPEIVRGFLSQSPGAYDKKLPFILRFLIGNLLLNFLISPDFIAYRFDDRKRHAFRLCTEKFKVKGVLWTIKNPDQHKAAADQGCLQIFEDYNP